MKEKNRGSRKALVNLELSTFEIPPSGDILVLGKRCPIGPEAAKRMLDSVMPDQFEYLHLEDDLIEAIFVKKYLFLRADKKRLVDTILEEAKAFMGPACMIRIKCEISLMVKREL
jgi:hypothetical protein